MNITRELENYSGQNSQAETFSKEYIPGQDHSLDIPGLFSSDPEMNLNKLTNEQEN